jgi:hypothetical protein
MDEARQNMTALVETNVQLDEWGDPQPDDGYNLIANNKYNQTSRNVSVIVHAGAKSLHNEWNINFGAGSRSPADPSMITYPIIGGIFRTMTSIWPTPWAMVRGSAVEHEYRPGVIGRTSAETFRHDISWMGYLSAELACGFTAPPELISEPTADGGVLMMSNEERPDPADPDQMRRSDLLGSIMDKYFPDPYPHLKPFGS